MMLLQGHTIYYIAWAFGQHNVVRTLGDVSCNGASPRSYNIVQTFWMYECMISNGHQSCNNVFGRLYNAVQILDSKW